MNGVLTELHGYTLERFDEIDSTSARARRDLASGRSVGRRRLLISATQTGGVGRFGRRYACPPGGLWCTLVAPLEGERRGVLEGLGLRVGLACLTCIEQTLRTDRDCASRVQFKWPNDVYVDGRKVSGALTEIVEAGGAGHVLIGVGVNANFTGSALPEGIRETATTLLDATGTPVSLDALLSCLARGLDEALRSPAPLPETAALLRDRLHGVGLPAGVTLPDGSTRHGELLGLRDDGRVCLRLADGDFTAPHGAALVV